MHKKLVEFLELLHGMLLLFAFIPLIAFAATKFQDGLLAEECLPYAFLILVPLVITYFAARWCRSVFFFLILCVLTACLFFLIPMATALRVFLMIFTVIIIIIRIAGRIHDGDALSSPSGGYLGVFALLFIVGIAADIPKLDTFSYYSAFLYVILLCIYWNETRLEEYLSLAETLEAVPRKQIARTNTGAMLLLIVITAVFMIAFPSMGIDRLLEKTGVLLLAVLRFLFSLAKKEKTETVSEAAESYASDTNPFEGLADGTDTNPFLEALEEYLFTFVQIFLIVLAVFIVLRIVIYVVRNFYRPYEDLSDRQEFIQKENDRKESVFRTVFMERLPHLDFSVTGSIRRIYKKKILQRLKIEKKARTSALGMEDITMGALYKAMTPDELENEARLEKSGERASFHALYEKARYGNKDMKKEDLEKMKSLEIK